MQYWLIDVIFCDVDTLNDLSMYAIRALYVFILFGGGECLIL